MAAEDIERIARTFVEFKETEHSKIFPNDVFGYWKIRVERPLRLHSQFSRRAVEGLRFASGDGDLRRRLYDEFGQSIYDDFHKVRPQIEAILTVKSESEDEEDSGKQSAVPEKRQKKLLDENTWKRDRRKTLVKQQRHPLHAVCGSPLPLQKK